MSKRRAEIQLTERNFDTQDDDSPIEKGGLELASSDVIKSRKILSVKRRLPNAMKDTNQTIQSKSLFAGLTSGPVQNAKSSSGMFSGFSIGAPVKPPSLGSMFGSSSTEATKPFASINFNANKTENKIETKIETKPEAKTEDKTGLFQFGSKSETTPKPLAPKAFSIDFGNSNPFPKPDEANSKNFFNNSGDSLFSSSKNTSSTALKHVPLSTLAFTAPIVSKPSKSHNSTAQTKMSESSGDDLDFFRNVQQLNIDFQTATISSSFCDFSKQCVEYLVYMRKLKKQKDLGKNIDFDMSDASTKLMSFLNTKMDQLMGLVSEKPVNKPEISNIENNAPKVDEKVSTAGLSTFSNNPNSVKSAEAFPLKEITKETSKETVKEPPKETLKVASKEMPKEIFKEPLKAPLTEETPKSTFFSFKPETTSNLNSGNNLQTKTSFGAPNSGTNMFASFSFSAATSNKNNENESQKATTSTSTFTFGAPTFTFGSTNATNNDQSKFPLKTFKSIENVPIESKDSAQDPSEENEAPPKVEAVEHEEESSVYSRKVKLYFQQNEAFVDKGLGVLYIKKKDGQRPQLLIRSATTTGNILLNIHLSTALPVKTVEKGVMITCLPNPPLAGKDQNDLVTFLLRVKTNADAEEVLKKFQEHRAD